MKHIVSVSLGASSRDHSVTVDLLGEQVLIERIGTDGNRRRAMQEIVRLDGEVDAFGMGGIDRYIRVGNKRYTFREAEKIATCARITPIFDGSGLKNSLERHVVRQLADHPLLSLRGKKVLLVSGVDRFGMAAELVAVGCEVTFGDLMFGLGLPVRIRSLAGLARVARVIAPLITRLPIRFLYPTGDKQAEIVERYAEEYRAADVIAGDFHFIRRHLPAELQGQTVLTNTVTAADLDLLRTRGAGALVTTTPGLSGRSFGTNVMEALLVALAGQRTELSAEAYLRGLADLRFEPRIEFFN
ncbi:quinate 5-dehydrogenase [Tumebacillus sp. DT12]|uniref:Quinate 5-dehydrogenase n=1 Tax=Tumebacillus lacus TaxID=2995335 RepID=A0ABT3XB82_9BACL|nr:quinate 5-dehydrogenase [Tumebacillus lacus]MCX7572014.1 quinate 5-dehydrogenase [Tumebacillus lacus]